MKKKKRKKEKKRHCNSLVQHSWHKFFWCDLHSENQESPLMAEVVILASGNPTAEAQSGAWEAKVLMYYLWIQAETQIL